MARVVASLIWGEAAARLWSGMLYVAMFGAAATVLSGSPTGGVAWEEIVFLCIFLPLCVGTFVHEAMRGKVWRKWPLGAALAAGLVGGYMLNGALRRTLQTPPAAGGWQAEHRMALSAILMAAGWGFAAFAMPPILRRLDRPKQGPPTCPGCGYELSGHEFWQRCPECGEFMRAFMKDGER